jgi:hypothetical protein
MARIASRIAVLNRVPSIGNAVLRANWCWPDRPLMRVLIDDRELAVADYLPASAAAHWFLRWRSGDVAPEGPELLPLMPLATHVPEEVDGDESMRAVALDTVLEAVASRLTGRAESIESRDG